MYLTYTLQGSRNTCLYVHNTCIGVKKMLYSLYSSTTSMYKNHEAAPVSVSILTRRARQISEFYLEAGIKPIFCT